MSKHQLLRILAQLVGQFAVANVAANLAFMTRKEAAGTMPGGSRVQASRQSTSSQPQP